MSQGIDKKVWFTTAEIDLELAKEASVENSLGNALDRFEELREQKRWLSAEAAAKLAEEMDNCTSDNGDGWAVIDTNQFNNWKRFLRGNKK